MKIGMMCLWNAANGPSIHAELIGRAWVEMGHKLTVFSAIKHPDARPTNQADEKYVIRHFSVDEVHPYTRASFFNPKPILEADFEIFVAQNVERLPAEKLLKYWDKIKRKAKTVMVAHEGKAPDDPLYYKFDWDRIVCFDERYKEYLLKNWSEDKIKLIPYPHYPFKPGDKIKSREKLGLPTNEKIIFSFGFRAEDILPVIPPLKELLNKYKLRYLVILNPESNVEIVKDQTKENKFIDLRVKALTMDEIYSYLYASDALLIHRESNKKYKAVVSSTVCQVLGAGCPIVFHNSNYVDTYGEEIIKYDDFEDLKKKLIELFDNGFDINKVKKFLEKNNATKIASRFIRLFEELKKEG